jgi:hypothetical protein
MSSPLGLPVLFVLAAARALGEEATATPVTESVKAIVKELYHYDPKIHERAVAAQAAKAEEVIQMEKVVVTDTNMLHRAPQVINDAWQKELESDFNLLNGGRVGSFSILGQPAEIGMWKYVSPLADDARFSSGQPPSPKIDLLHIKF